MAADFFKFILFFFLLLLSSCVCVSVCRTLCLAVDSVGVDSSRPTIPTEAHLWPEGPEPFHPGSTRRRSRYGERKMYARRTRLNAWEECYSYRDPWIILVSCCDTGKYVSSEYCHCYFSLEVMQGRMWPVICLCTPNHCQLWWLGEENCKFLKSICSTDICRA